MAEWGQGDPRWLVEHREDGRNVNGWHWEEKSILQQVKSRLADTFSNVAVDLGGKQGELTIDSCKDISGEAAIVTRKGNKRLAVYDIKMTIDLTAVLAGSGKKVSGSMKVEEFASASEESDYIIEITTTPATGVDEDAARGLMASHAQPEVVRRLVSLAKELLEV